MLTVGTTMNGMIMVGFSTMGRPKMIGSLMLKIPATRDSFPRELIRLDLQNSTMAITRDRVDPAPPKVANRSWNCWQIICPSPIPVRTGSEEWG